MLGVILEIFVVGPSGSGPLVFRHLLGPVAIIHHSVDLVPVDVGIVMSSPFSYFVDNVGGIVLGFYFVVMVTTINIEVEGWGSCLGICLFFIRKQYQS